MDFEQIMGLGGYDAHPLLTKAAKLMDRGKHEEVLIACDKVLNEMPKEWMAHKLKASLYNELERYDEAIECINRAIKYSREPFKGICLCTKVQILSKSGRHTEAARWSDKAIRSGFDFPMMYHIKGCSLHQIYDETPDKKLAEKALHCYDKALKNDPTFMLIEEAMPGVLDSARKNVLNNKGRLLISLERHDEAIECFDEELLLDPDDAATWEDKSVALYLANRRDEAIECCKKVIELDSRDPKVLFSLADTLNDLDLLQEALDTLNIALKLEPSNIDGKELYQQIISTLNLR